MAFRRLAANFLLALEVVAEEICWGIEWSVSIRKLITVLLPLGLEEVIFERVHSLWRDASGKSASLGCAWGSAVFREEVITVMCCLLETGALWVMKDNRPWIRWLSIVHIYLNTTKLMTIEKPALLIIWLLSLIKSWVHACIVPSNKLPNANDNFEVRLLRKWAAVKKTEKCCENTPQYT